MDNILQRAALIITQINSISQLVDFFLELMSVGSVRMKSLLLGVWRQERQAA
jgi:hypothetical protein